MLCRSQQLKRSVSLLNKSLKSRVHNTPQQWLGKLFTTPIPKGFGKFYPPNGGSGGASAGKSAGTFDSLL